MSCLPAGGQTLQWMWPTGHTPSAWQTRFLCMHGLCVSMTEAQSTMSKSCKQTPSQLNHRGNYPLAKLGKGMPKFGKKHQPWKKILHWEESSFPNGLLSMRGGRTDGFCIQSPGQRFKGMCSVFSAASLNSAHLHGAVQPVQCRRSQSWLHAGLGPCCM